MNRVNARPFALDYFGLRAWDDENVFIVLGSVLNVVNLFMNVTLHAAAQWRVELR